MSTTSHPATVKNGPEAGDIIHSLLYAKGQFRLPVEFTADIHDPGEGYIEDVILKAIITGVRYKENKPGNFEIEFDIKESTKFCRGSGYYNAVHRQGTFVLFLL